MELNRLKVLLVERKKTGKWLAETLGKNEATVSRWCANVSQLWGIERSGFFNGREKWAKGFENQRV